MMFRLVLPQKKLFRIGFIVILVLLHVHFIPGHYACKACDLPLYSFASKFDSGCGWPAYDKCYHSDVGCHVEFKVDNAHGMMRTEILCKKCDGHLGHVFFGEKGPNGERHCVNSVAVKYVDAVPTEAEIPGLKDAQIKPLVDKETK